MTKNLYKAMEERRSYYEISKEEVISDDKIQEIIGHALKHTPSAFNSQSSRVVILFAHNHTKLWDTTMSALRKIVPVDEFDATKERINSFNNGYGTILFFEDNSVVQELQKNYELYKDNFPVWAQQTSGMLQHAIWIALELEGYGASLQHYSELIETDVKKEWELPDTWKLIAQMPFGKPTSEPGEKEFAPLEDRLVIFK